MQRFPQLYGNVQQLQQQQLHASTASRSSSVDPSHSNDSSSQVSSTVSSSATSSSTPRRFRGPAFGANPRFTRGRWGPNRGRRPRASSSSFGRSSSSTTTGTGTSQRVTRATAASRGAEHVILDSEPRMRGSAMGPSGRTQDEIDELDSDSDNEEREGIARFTKGNDEDWVTCVAESKGAGQRTVGIAAFQPSTATCVLTQLNDSQTYVKTTHTLSVRWPSIILTAGTASMNNARLRALDPSAKAKLDETLLLKALQAAFGSKKRVTVDHGSRAGSITSSRGGEEGSSAVIAGASEGVEITGLARRFFEANAGLSFVSELIINNDDTPATLAAIQGKYYALSAAAALFKFFESHNSLQFSPGTLKIKYAPLEGTMLMDGDSVKNLELIENIMDRKNKRSLFGFLNHCYTPMAARLLRSNILSPLTDAPTIDARLDAVAELLANHERFRSLRKAMRAIERIDADKLTGTILSSSSISQSVKMQSRKSMDAAKESERKLGIVLQLRTFIKAIPAVSAALMIEGGCQSAILDSIAKVLGDERLKKIELEIQETINENMLEAMKGTALATRTSRVFAIRAEKKKLLDVARETFKENIADVDELREELQQKYPDILEQVDLQYSPSNGFTFALAESVLQEKGLDLPRIFNKLARKGKKVVFSCVDLLKRNQRIQQSLDEVFLLSSDVLDELFESIRNHIAALYRTSEVIAMLDMLCAFTNVATTNTSYTRPEFTDTLAIKDGRHPVLEKFASESFVPNDTYATEAASFQLLTGPNMSGKTTFLKQIACTVIMSQIGSYIPAEYGSFRIHNALLTRLSNDDSLEGNLSTFALEMKTMSMILSALGSTENALVIVDELGRGTSPQEGVGIAHAIAEEIIRHKSFCFFATHFHDLSTTLSMYPNVVSLHLETDTTALRHEAASTSLLNSSKEFSMTFSHRVRDGVTTTPNYGLEIAKVAALPELMLDSARLATMQLMSLYELRKKDAVGTKIAKRRKAILEVAGRLKQACNSHRLSDEELGKYIFRVTDFAIERLAEDDEEEEDEAMIDEIANTNLERQSSPAAASAVSDLPSPQIKVEQSYSRRQGNTNAYGRVIEVEEQKEDDTMSDGESQNARQEDRNDSEMPSPEKTERSPTPVPQIQQKEREPTVSPPASPPVNKPFPLFAPGSPASVRGSVPPTSPESVRSELETRTIKPHDEVEEDDEEMNGGAGSFSQMQVYEPAHQLRSHSERSLGVSPFSSARNLSRSAEIEDEYSAHQLDRYASSQSMNVRYDKEVAEELLSQNRGDHNILAEQSWEESVSRTASQAGPRLTIYDRVASSQAMPRLSAENLSIHDAAAARGGQRASAYNINFASTPPSRQPRLPGHEQREEDNDTEVMSGEGEEGEEAVGSSSKSAMDAE